MGKSIEKKTLSVGGQAFVFLSEGQPDHDSFILCLFWRTNGLMHTHSPTNERRDCTRYYVRIYVHSTGEGHANSGNSRAWLCHFLGYFGHSANFLHGGVFCKPSMPFDFSSENWKPQSSLASSSLRHVSHRACLHTNAMARSNLDFCTNERLKQIFIPSWSKLCLYILSQYHQG